MDPAKSDVSRGGNNTPDIPPATECPQCHRKVMSLAAPRCVFCGAPLREGEVHWNEQRAKSQQVRDADNERARALAFRPMPPALPPEARAAEPTPAPVNDFTMPDESAFRSRADAGMPEVNSPMHDFLFPYYLGRMGYFCRLMFLAVALFVVCGILFYVARDPVRIIVIGLLVLGAKIYQVVGLARARARDANLDAWFAYLLFVPVAGFVFGGYLLFAPSSSDA